MNGGLGKHGVVLKFTLAERRSVGSDDDQLSLTRAQSLHGRLSTQCDFTGLHHQGEPGVDLAGGKLTGHVGKRKEVRSS